jgi:hypothetical protein
MKWSDQSFVDFYDLLDDWPDADTNALRKRIAELYQEARENLEHTNHRKRYYYRELYEVQLPQARMILLDPQKRQDYDHELSLYWKQKGKPKTPSKPKEAPTPPKLDGLPGAVEEPKAADDFSDFADVDEESLPPFQLPKMLMDKEVVERRRDYKRRELIKHELMATGARWAVIGGLAGLILAGGVALILFKLLNLHGINLVYLAAAVVLGVTIISGRQAMRWAKRRVIGVLSQMPYDQLLRECGAA